MLIAIKTGLQRDGRLHVGEARLTLVIDDMPAPHELADKFFGTVREDRRKGSGELILRSPVPSQVGKQ